MKLQIVPASRGLQWLLLGLRVFGTRPFVYMGLIGAWLLFVALVQLIPLVGTLLVWATLPFVTLGFMLVTRLVTEGTMPTLQVFAQPLRGDALERRRLWQLGAIYAALMAALFGVFLLTLGPGLMDAAPAAQPAPPAPDSAASAPQGLPMPFGPQLQAGLLWMATLSLLLSVPFWYAPALVHWAGQSAGQALFSSVIAVWRNKGAFLVYGLACFALTLGATVAMSLLAMLLSAVSQQLALAMVVPMAFVLLAIFHAALYFTYTDCFGTPSPQETSP